MTNLTLKLKYDAPYSELLEVKTESFICVSKKIDTENTSSEGWDRDGYGVMEDM